MPSMNFSALCARCCIIALVSCIICVTARCRRFIVSTEEHMWLFGLIAGKFVKFFSPLFLICLFCFLSLLCSVLCAPVEKLRIPFKGNQGLHHYRDKTSHYVDLDVYDICEEAKGIKTASNVLVISSSEIEKSFFETVCDWQRNLSFFLSILLYYFKNQSKTFLLFCLFFKIPFYLF